MFELKSDEAGVYPLSYRNGGFKCPFNTVGWWPECALKVSDMCIE
jgi:hypothetical protein